MYEQPMFGQQYQPVPSNNFSPLFTNTNKIVVESIDEAVKQFTRANSVTVYFTKDDKSVIEIFTNARGDKFFKQYDLTLHEEQQKPVDTPPYPIQAYATQEQILALEGKIDSLISSLGGIEQKQTKGGSK